VIGSDDDIQDQCHSEAVGQDPAEGDELVVLTHHRKDMVRAIDQVLDVVPLALGRPPGFAVELDELVRTNRFGEQS
jgi:hypothetical protein